MSEEQQSTFIITREGHVDEPKKVVEERLLIGRSPRRALTGLFLNHRAVARRHAWIVRTKGRFRLVNLSVSSPMTLNGRPIPFNHEEALSVGDKIQIGPFFLNIAEADGGKGTLSIKVVRHYGLAVGELEARRAAKREAEENRQARPLPADHVVDIYFADKRTRKRAGRLSPLYPKARPRPGMERFNWAATKDLVSPWPIGVFAWAAVLIGALSATAAVVYRDGFASRPVSAPHARKDFASAVPIATHPSGGSCTSCHVVGLAPSNRERMNTNCAACHQTEAFSANVTRAHREAGITCTDCHGEHGGGDFSPMRAGLESCAKCHTDENKNLYNGKGVHTSHGGTYGYPVLGGVWAWKGLDDEELVERPELVEFLNHNRGTPADEQLWRRLQFHDLHFSRIRAAADVVGVADADTGLEVLACVSCHKAGYNGAAVDRTFPRTTCGRCHNTRVFDRASPSPAGDETPNCSSCHVQHFKDGSRDAWLTRAGLMAPTSASVR